MQRYVELAPSRSVSYAFKFVCKRPDHEIRTGRYSVRDMLSENVRRRQCTQRTFLKSISRVKMFATATLDWFYRGTFTFANISEILFSNSLIHQVKTWIIITGTGICIDFLRLYFSVYSLVLFRLRRYTKHSRQCFIGYPNTSNFVKNTPLRVVFLILFSVFAYDNETLF